MAAPPDGKPLAFVSWRLFLTNSLFSDKSPLAAPCMREKTLPTDGSAAGVPQDYASAQ